MSYSEFKASFQDMARPNRFELTEIGLLTQPLLIKAASLPGVSSAAVEVFHDGRPVKLAGDRTYEDWNVTCHLDKNGVLFNEIHKWVNIACDSTNFGSTNKEDYKFDVGVRMLDRAGNPITGTEFKLIGAFPTTVDPLELAHDTNDTAAEFDIKFDYDFDENVK